MCRLHLVCRLHWRLWRGYPHRLVGTGPAGTAQAARRRRRLGFARRDDGGWSAWGRPARRKRRSARSWGFARRHDGGWSARGRPAWRKRRDDGGVLGLKQRFDDSKQRFDGSSVGFDDGSGSGGNACLAMRGANKEEQLMGSRAALAAAAVAAAAAVRQGNTASVCSSIAATTRSGGSSGACASADVSISVLPHASAQVARAKPCVSAAPSLAASLRADSAAASSTFGLRDAAGSSLPEPLAGAVLAPRAHETVKCPKVLKASSEAVAAQKDRGDKMVQYEVWSEATELDDALAEHAGQDVSVGGGKHISYVAARQTCLADRPCSDSPWRHRRRFDGSGRWGRRRPRRRR